MSGRPWGTSYSPFVRQEYQVNSRFDSNLGLWISICGLTQQIAQSKQDRRSLFHHTGNIDPVWARGESDGCREDEDAADPRPRPEMIA
jgi:hypothetical protein